MGAVSMQQDPLNLQEGCRYPRPGKSEVALKGCRHISEPSMMALSRHFRIRHSFSGARHFCIFLMSLAHHDGSLIIKLFQLPGERASCSPRVDFKADEE
jgi:hypothetical protein